MNPMLRYCKQTWWLWLLLTAGFVVLALKVSGIFWILIPFLLAYSMYFGLIRVSEVGDNL